MTKTTGRKWQYTLKRSSSSDAGFLEGPRTHQELSKSVLVKAECILCRKAVLNTEGIEMENIFSC